MFFLSQKEEILNKYKNTVLKDTDLELLKIKFFLDKKDAKNLIAAVENDSDFLAKYHITDYSLLTSIHNYDKDIYKQFFTNTRIFKSTDEKYLFSFAIIDFLTVKNLFKIGL